MGRWALLVAGLLLGWPAPASGAIEHDIKRCNGEANPDLKIGACTALIQSGRFDNHDLAVAFNNRGIAYREKGQIDSAIQDYDQAIRLKLNYAAAFNNRGLAYSDKGQYDRAIQDYDQAIRFQPDDAFAFNNRGLAYSDKGQYDRAIQDYDQAMRLKPNDAAAFGAKAWLLATRPQDRLRNGAEAVRLARRAVALRDSAGFRDTLAAAHAEAGDFAAAVREQERALGMARDAGQDKIVARLQARLDLYRQGRPYREK